MLSICTSNQYWPHKQILSLFYIITKLIVWLHSTRKNVQGSFRACFHYINSLCPCHWHDINVSSDTVRMSYRSCWNWLSSSRYCTDSLRDCTTILRFDILEVCAINNAMFIRIQFLIVRMIFKGNKYKVQPNILIWHHWICCSIWVSFTNKRLILVCHE